MSCADPEIVATLQAWIAQVMQDQPADIFPLLFPSQEVPTLSEFADDIKGVELRRREKSGVPVFHLSGASETAFIERYVNWMLRVAALEDDRGFSRADPRSGVVITEWRSLIPRTRLPVVGPGGRLTLRTTGRGLLGEIVIRRRGTPQPSIWRLPAELATLVAGAMAVRTNGNPFSIIELQLGYFECSLYERQDWLRPAIVALIEINGRDEHSPRWRDAIVFPASDMDKISSSEGLGSWVE